MQKNGVFIYIIIFTQGTVLIKSAEELKNFSKGEEDMMEIVSCDYNYSYTGLLQSGKMGSFENYGSESH